MKIAIAGPVRVQPLRPWLELTPQQSSRLPHGQGGTSTTQLVQGLLSQGVKLVVITLDPTLTTEDAYSGPDLRLRLGPLRGGGRGRDAFRPERAYIRDALGLEAPDVVHAHWTYEYALGALASGCPTITTVRDWAPSILRHSPDAYRVVRLLMHLTTLAWGRHFIAASPYIQRRVQRWTTKPVRVIPNALADEAFQSTVRQPGNPPVLTALNITFTKRKNVEALLEAFPRVRAVVPGCRLQLVGDDFGPGGPAYQWAAVRNLTGGVEFCGTAEHEDVPTLLRDSDVFVHPALEESFGNVLVEAMAQGVPVVAGAHSGAVPWVLDQGHAGVLTDVTSPAAIADSVIGLLSNRQRYRDVAAAGLAHATKQFRLSSTVQQHLDAYQQVRAGSTRPPGRLARQRV